MADSATLITWTPANWITVVLMVLLMYVVVGAIARVIQQKKKSQATS